MEASCLLMITSVENDRVCFKVFKYPGEVEFAARNVSRIRVEVSYKSQDMIT